MHHKRFALSAAAALIGLAIACSKSPETPVAPGGVPETSPGAAADGSTLKVTAPTPVSPINNAQLDTLVLTTNKATGKFDTSIAPSYEFEIKTGAGATVAACATTIAGGSATTVSYTPTCTLEFDQPHTWRTRAVFAGGVGPWSAAATFRTPAGGYIRAQEIFDPLTTGKTVGTAINTRFVAGKGIELLSHESRVTYVLPESLQSGEVSVMVTGIDEGSPGDKTKVFSMQEGFSDITANDYRFTVEKRGRNYETPGATTFRIITGDAGEDDSIQDGTRLAVAYSDERWYFWKATWRNGFAAVEVREDGPTGRVIYAQSTGTDGHPYRPQPHVIHLGQSIGRAGPIDASIPGAIYKNLWVSARVRPNFPGLIEKP